VRPVRTDVPRQEVCVIRRTSPGRSSSSTLRIPLIENPKASKAQCQCMHVQTDKLLAVESKARVLRTDAAHLSA